MIHNAKYGESETHYFESENYNPPNPKLITIWKTSQGLINWRSGLKV